MCTLNKYYPLVRNKGKTGKGEQGDKREKRVKGKKGSHFDFHLRVLFRTKEIHWKCTRFQLFSKFALTS